MSRSTCFARFLSLLSLLLAVPAAAQADGMATAEGMPPGWMMRFDRAGATADMANLRVMEPGWHITTGRAGSGIYWMPDMTASGDYALHATYHLFDPASHAESFGLFTGGEDLGGADQEYLYFLVRQTGEYLIKRRSGTETETVVGWTAHDVIPRAPAGERGPTQYDLAIDVDGDEVRFTVNGAVVDSLPASRLDTDGVVGLRVNHMLDLHVEELALDRGG